MTAKEQAMEMVANHFGLLGVYTGYKNVKCNKEDEFLKLEKIAKESALIGVDSFINFMPEINPDSIAFWEEVKKEIELL